MKTLIVKKTLNNGMGVFAGCDFEKGDKIIDFRGKLLTFSQLPVPYNQVEDHFVQIGEDLYMGPSGGTDDFFNHSCEPNSGLVVQGRKVLLKAIKNIKKGREIVWDYSTTMDEKGRVEDYWEMDCECGSKKCRKRIQDFKFLPKPLQKKYVKEGVVPEFIIKRVGNI